MKQWFEDLEIGGQDLAMYFVMVCGKVLISRRSEACFLRGINNLILIREGVGGLVRSTISFQTRGVRDACLI